MDKRNIEVDIVITRELPVYAASGKLRIRRSTIREAHMADGFFFPDESNRPIAPFELSDGLHKCG